MLETDRATSEPRLAGQASVEQRAIALLDEIQDRRSARVILLDVKGRLEPTLLERAWRSLVERHDALRTSFADVDGSLHRQRRPRTAADAIGVELIEPAGVMPRERALDTVAETPFRTSGWPLCRAVLVQSAPDRHLLALAFHPIIFDEHSIELVVRELLALYDETGNGEHRALPHVPDDSSDFVDAEQRTIEGRLEEARRYWEPTLQSVGRAPRVPVREVDGQAMSSRRRSVEVRVELDVKTQLERLANETRTSLFSALVAAVQTLQHRYAGPGADGITTALTVDARPRALRDSIGMFSNELPFLSHPSDGLPFRDFVIEVDPSLRELFALRRFPFTEALGRFSESGGSPEAAGQVGMTYRRAPDISAPRGIEILSRELAPRAGIPRPLIIAFADETAGLSVTFDFDAERFPTDTARRMSEHLRRLLASIAARPDAPIGRLDMLSPRERDRILADWSTGRRSASERPAGGPEMTTVEAMVERQVLSTPQAPAVASGSATLSYETLNARANRLARRLRDRGVGPDVPVGICVKRSPELVVGMLAILKAGGAYLPLDASYPATRLQVMADLARPRVILSQTELSDRLPRTRGLVLLVDRDATEIAREGDENVESSTGPGDLAYVIFTSGSTGEPKGVAMPHSALCNLLQWQRDAFRTQGPRRTLQFASSSFDVAFQDIFSTLTTGGELVIASDDLRRDFDELARFIDERRIERLFLPPLALVQLAERLADIRSTDPVEVIVAGERLEITPAIRELLRNRPGWTLENQYGPTESHVVTAHPLGANVDRLPEHPPIGRPIPGARIYLLNGARSPVPVGVPGELYVGGHSLARGYLGQPRLTVERFVEDPFVDKGARMYRTGDLARWTADGTIEFLGRADDQVKIRGFRVEPGEVASALLKHPTVAQAAVVADEDPSQGKRLVAYVVTAEGRSATNIELRVFLSSALPAYMVPAAFVTLDSLPLTPNGKLDRRALPAPDRADREDIDDTVMSATEASVAAVWAEVLGFERIGPDDNFFSLGGHSLLAADVVSKCSRALGVDLPMRALFSGPTVRQLAAAVEHAREHGTSESRIPRAPRRLVSEAARPS